MDTETISYAFADTSLGRLLVGMSDTGVTWVGLGESETSMLDALARSFPRAELMLAGDERSEWVAAVVGHVEDSRHPKEVPLDLRGTEFQRAVWDALLAVPPGRTRSYSEIARAVGRPTAVRAVAQACGANPVGVVVPCHRVIGADGSLTGYAGGLPLKRALLTREGAL
ncbi:MAG: methylated-DNA--[protein]-cysteine S-methyltransferase [Coriobacteriaceae bacterium]|nr:methylated-DNA--[protein]-cysteine S-methyltransferase [Coriobacteriaceae bacterium]